MMWAYLLHPLEMLQCVFLQHIADILDVPLIRLSEERFCDKNNVQWKLILGFDTLTGNALAIKNPIHERFYNFSIISTNIYTLTPFSILFSEGMRSAERELFWAIGIHFVFCWVNLFARVFNCKVLNILPFFLDGTDDWRKKKTFREQAQEWVSSGEVEEMKSEEGWWGTNYIFRSTML